MRTGTAAPGTSTTTGTTTTSYAFEFTNLRDTGTLTLSSSCTDPQWRQYDSYGNPRGTRPSSWPDPDDAFLGKPQDPNTGLDIIGARNYDPTTGRFVSLDPMLNATDPQALNGYSYADDDPVNDSDPTGLILGTGTVGNQCVNGGCKGVDWSDHENEGTGIEDVPGGTSTAICYYCYDPKYPPPVPPFPMPAMPQTIKIPYNAWDCGRFGLECGGTLTEYNNSNEDDTLFVDWVLGMGQSQHFNQWDPLTGYLMHDPFQAIVIADAKHALETGGKLSGSEPYIDPSTIAAFRRDVKGFLTGGTDPSGSNYADAFLGAYKEEWWAIPRNGNTAAVYFKVTNTTDLNSFLHPTITTEGAFRSVDGGRHFVGPAMDSFALGVLSIGEGGSAAPLGALGLLDPASYAPQEQTFEWQESNIGY